MPDTKAHEQPLHSRKQLNQTRRVELPPYRNESLPFIVATNKKYLLVKRCLDTFFSAFILLGIMSWLIPILALLIKLDSPGPVFFTQRRIGKNGKQFLCYKLRTMLFQPEEEDIPAVRNDARITKVGHFLRRTNLDELPQFLNVLLGQMSIVGPRPHMSSDCIRFSFVISAYSFRHIVRPGITGLAQVKGFHGPAQDYESIIQRYYWDTEYIRNTGARLDCSIILKTIFMIGRNFLPKKSTKHL